MLIRRAELEGGEIASVRIAGGKIAAIGDPDPVPGDTVIDAHGGLLLPGLHDHHIHLAAYAASLASVRCGPPEVADFGQFAACLDVPGSGWLRATGYHESVAGLLDAATLDRIVSDRPVRVQHRSGRMWFFNTAGLDLLLAGNQPPPGLDRRTGRLFDCDTWLRQTLRSEPPSFGAVGTALAKVGVTGLTDMSPSNDALMARHFAREIGTGALPQRVLLAGSPALGHGGTAGPRLSLGAVKLHLHEADLPSLADACHLVAAAHDQGRVVAVHCATEVELIFTLAVFADAGVRYGDRIEHASVASDFAIEEIARLGLAVVTQPHFIAERGDAYHRDVEPEAQSLLYRLQGFVDAGIPLAAGSDAPFGAADPWASMAAAVSRKTGEGRIIGPAEALPAEQALDLYLRDPVDLRRRRRVAVGAEADLCLLDRPWRDVRQALSSRSVRTVLVEGRIVHDRVPASGPLA